MIDSTSAPQKKLPADRTAMLSQEIDLLMAEGGRIESRTDFQAVLVKGKPINHLLHLFLTLCTLGVWSIVWIFLAIAGGEKRVLLKVDEYGTFIRTKVQK